MDKIFAFLVVITGGVLVAYIAYLWVRCFIDIINAPADWDMRIAWCAMFLLFPFFSVILFVLVGQDQLRLFLKRRKAMPPPLRLDDDYTYRRDRNDDRSRRRDHPGGYGDQF